MIYILFICLIIMLIVSFYIYKKDIIEPSIVLIASYALSVFCVLINVEKWGIHLSNKAFWILLLGTLEFVSISYMINIIFKRKNKNYEPKEIILKEVNFSKILTLGVIIYNIVVLILLIYNVLKISNTFGNYTSFSEALTLYKSHTSYANHAELPDYLTIIMKPIIASAYVYVFFYIRNIVYTNEKKYKIILKYWYYLIPAITYFIQRISESNRGSIINFILSAIVMYFVLVNVNNNWKPKLMLKTIVRLVISGIICLMLFYCSTALVGRVNTKGMIDYITCYCGGSIECFNLYIQEEDSIRGIRGEETFNSPIKDLIKIGILSKDTKITPNNAPFRYYKGNLIGNVYSSYKRWIHDYGIIGAIILQAILAIIFSIAYNMIKYWKWSNKGKNLAIIIYSYFMYTIFMHPIDSLFYLETFTIYTCGVIIFMVLLYWLLTRNINFEYTNKLYDENNIKVLNVTPGLNLCGGIESYSMNYYRNLSSKIHMDFITHEIKDEEYKNEIIKNGDKVFLLKTLSLKNLLYNVYQISKFFKENHDYDIIHCNMANAAVFYFYFAKKYNINIRILHSHQNNYSDKFINKLRNIPLIYLGKKMATVNFACSKLAGDFLFKRDKYYIIKNAIDVNKYKYNEDIRNELRNKMQLENNDIILGNIGRLTEQKNQIFLIDIMLEIVKNNANYKLIIIGDGELKKKIEEQIINYKLTNNVILLGSVNNVQDYLQMIDIFVLPSLYEGLGIVNIEAQAAGLPTIVSDRIPEDAKITDLIKYISLKFDKSYWAREILNISKNNNRIDYNEKVEMSEYNIKLQAQELDKLYSNLIKEN